MTTTTDSDHRLLSELLRSMQGTRGGTSLDWAGLTAADVPRAVRLVASLTSHVRKLSARAKVGGGRGW